MAELVTMVAGDDPLIDVIEMVNCGVCWAVPRSPCTALEPVEDDFAAAFTAAGGRWYHQARRGRADRKGLLAAAVGGKNA